MAARHDSQEAPLTGYSSVQSDAGSIGVPDFGDNIDLMTFEQILEMDDDEEEREFSSSIVFGFFEQAENTFKSMDASLAKKDLDTLSSLGHFLKGSSATLGLTKVKDSCEKIQHYGAHKDETGNTAVPDSGICLDRIKTTMVALKRDYSEAESILRRFYHDQSN
ncbi:MAG: hypothetical protein LQ344_006050 [Seirophora lacunosa]|nr:MAG: hypothetical protein LQ344_006050 [Seirophora lacunosa]